MRNPEWITAEAALEHSCQQAQETGLRLVYDSYGLNFRPQADKITYDSSGEDVVCVVGSYLLGKEPKEFIWDKDAALYLGVSLDWIAFLEEGFAGEDMTDERWYRLSEDERDGYETGVRLHNKFTPGRVSLASFG